MPKAYVNQIEIEYEIIGDPSSEPLLLIAGLGSQLLAWSDEICEKCGAKFVKTSTGYGTGGATIPDLELMRATVSENVQVKAAGGVRTLDTALAVREAGATRFGATATETIMKEWEERFGGE